ncbi:MAG TPA: acetyl-CoA hydrolase/transferase C-terminal domain-containing protein [Bacteroidia bacterium]|nr:acetyl-CoA hydrolase/transferase C-terminal domain-containing protein [Bacteroidia bacterium]HRH08413.1 acetyl-CoA hydrolase/transferase C-terminal domain-containing protein [Bacteroidia bacterium]
MIKYISAQNALQLVSKGDRIFIQGGCASPQLLVKSLIDRHTELTDVEIIHLHTEGIADYARPEYSASFKVNVFFTGSNIRSFMNHQNVQYIPMFLSEIPAFFRKGKMPIDIALIQVSTPDEQGFCSLGISVDIAKAATEVSKKIIALVNPNMPHTFGDGQLHYSKFSAIVYDESAILEQENHLPSENELKIGYHVASLIEDGATIQMGIGGIPSAVLSCLHSHKNLGIHTEMFTDSILPLVEKGIINGSKKFNHRGKIVSTFVMGTRKLYDFIHNNEQVEMLDAAYVNNTSVIHQNPKVAAINSAIEIDLSGQICADSIGSKIYSGVGGQMDFIRGASLSEGGKPIIAMPSVTANGISKLVATLKPGAGVVTTRAHVHYVVTEYGVADLYGKNLAQRAKALIGIAHPNHQEVLEKSAYELYGKL